MNTVLMNDQFVNQNEATFSFDDRSMYFGDGLYEVVRVYGGYPYKMEMHLQRLLRSAEELDIPYSTEQKQQLRESLMRLIEMNELHGDGFIYVQLSRGAAPRDHLYERNIEPFLFAFVRDKEIPAESQKNGVSVYLTEDIRWLRCDIKSVNLLGNVMAKRKAADHDCAEAVLHRENEITEGSSSNLFIVKNGRLQTHPATNLILNGITRQVILDFADQQGISVELNPFTISEAMEADEAFLTSTIMEITPVRAWRGTQYGKTEIGPITRKFQELLQQDIEKTRNGQ